jgi:hypothetical protein
LDNKISNNHKEHFQASEEVKLSNRASSEAVGEVVSNSLNNNQVPSVVQLEDLPDSVEIKVDLEHWELASIRQLSNSNQEEFLEDRTNHNNRMQDF